MNVIAAYLDAVVRKDASVVDRFFHPEIEYSVNGPQSSPALPWFGVYHGRDALKGFLEHMHRNLEITEFGPLDLISEGQKGAAFGWFRLRTLPLGRTADVSFAINFEVRDGLISKYHFIENTLEVANAFRSGGSWLVTTDGTEKLLPPLSVQCFTSSEAGAWSNSYLIAGVSEAVLFDVVMLRSDAMNLAGMIERSGKTLTTIIISHAHPDHFATLEVISERFPQARIVGTENVVNDLRADGQWMISLLQQKFGAEAPARLVMPQVLAEAVVHIDSTSIDVVEFGESESKHIGALYSSDLRALFCADLLYNNAHAYVAERHLDSWFKRLDELEEFVKERVSVIYPGHGSPGDASLIGSTRAYLNDFTDAVKLGDAKRAQHRMLAKYSDYHVKQFLTAFSVPAYFPMR